MDRVEWDDKPFIGQVMAEGKRRLRDAVAFGAATAKKNMQHSDFPSAPGEYPRVVTGTLRQNITFAVAETPKGPVGRFGVLGRTSGAKPLEYALYLERGTRRMAPRPWLTLTINQCMPEWQRIIGGGASASIAWEE